MAFESGVIPKDWRTAVTVLLYKGKGERNECKNYRGISKVCRVTESLIDDELEVFRPGRRCVDQIFTLRQIGEKAQERKKGVRGFCELGNGINRGEAV